jgi:hypothetical protein
MPRYVIHTYTLTDPKTGRRWHKQNPWDIARLVMMHGDWKRYVSSSGPSSESDVTWRITNSILNGTWDNQFPIEPDGEMIRSIVPLEASHPIQKAHSVAEALGAIDRRLRNGRTYSTFPDLAPEMAMTNMLSVLREQNRQQRLGDGDRDLLEKIERTFAFQSRREAAMAMLLWELRKEYEQSTLLSRAATEGETLDREGIRLKQMIARIDDALAMSGN